MRSRGREIAHDAIHEGMTEVEIAEAIDAAIEAARAPVAEQPKNALGFKIPQSIDDLKPVADQPVQLSKLLEEMRTRTQIIRRDSDALNVVQFQSGEVIDLIQQAFEHLPKREIVEPDYIVELIAASKALREENAALKLLLAVGDKRNEIEGGK